MLTVKRDPEIDCQIMLCERQVIEEMIDTVSGFGASCRICAISQSLYDFSRNLVGQPFTLPSVCEISCPSFKRCQLFINARADFIGKLHDIKWILEEKITAYEVRKNEQH